MHAHGSISTVFLRPKIVFGNETGTVESESSGSLGGEEFASSKPLAYVQQVSILRFFSYLEYKNSICQELRNSVSGFGEGHGSSLPQRPANHKGCVSRTAGHRLQTSPGTLDHL